MQNYYSVFQNQIPNRYYNKNFYEPPSFIFENINLVIEGNNKLGNVYVGNIKAAKDIETLKKYNIHSVLTIASYTGIVYHPSIVPYHKVIFFF